MADRLGRPPWLPRLLSLHHLHPSGIHRRSLVYHVQSSRICSSKKVGAGAELARARAALANHFWQEEAEEESVRERGSPDTDGGRIHRTAAEARDRERYRGVVPLV
eukprot:c20345_g1_i1 orf=239-556(+)